MPETCKGKICPQLSSPAKLTECIEHRCAHYQQMLGVNPQTDEPLGYWDCAFNWANILRIENSKEVRQMAAAVESFRNENVGAAQMLSSAVLTAANRTKPGLVKPRS